MTTFNKILYLVIHLQDMVSDIALKWTQLARTGAIGVTFMGFDITTVMFTLQNAQNIFEVSFIPSKPF